MKHNALASAGRAVRPEAWSARPRWRIARGEEIALGPGKVDLLEAIDRAGSISAAAVALGMSYRRAWVLVATMNQCFLRPLVATSAHRARGAALTPDGRLVLRLYRRIETRSRRAAQADLAHLSRLLS
jgi:molybdate transport system regulatory protein